MHNPIKPLLGSEKPLEQIRSAIRPHQVEALTSPKGSFSHVDSFYGQLV